ncbi:ABC transporter substrate-binding protein [Kribbella deserti]|uniref:Extracellular solute-binding protein n=1 Tax=Kribbella deserti TaxID=1926257 RepID=A0ABV6QDJ3_9ACTN
MRPSARRTTLTATAVGLALLATACGGDEPGSKPGEPVELTIATFNEFGYAELYREYEAAHPDIKITERKSGTVDAHVDNLNTKLAAGSGLADIEAMEVSWINTYLAKADRFVDLREFGAEDLKSRWLDWKTAGATAKDGRVIGYGTDIGPMAICYRKDLFAKAGLPTDRASVAKLFPSWDAYFAVGKQYVAKVPKSAWYDSAGQTWEAMRNQLIQAYYTNEDRYIGAENQGLKATWDKIMQGTSDGLSAKLEAWSDDWVKAFRTDAFATVACPGWLLGVIEGNAAEYGKGKWDVADVFPGGGGNWGGSYLTVPAQSKHQKEAAELAAWLTAPAQQIKVFKKVGAFPSTVAAYTDAKVTGQKNAYFNNAPVGPIFINRAKAVTIKQYKGPKDGDVNQGFTQALGRVEQGKQSPDEAWAQALKDGERAAKG